MIMSTLPGYMQSEPFREDSNSILLKTGNKLLGLVTRLLYTIGADACLKCYLVFS